MANVELENPGPHAAALSAQVRIAANLDEVDNTSDMDKPISTATQAALDAKPSSTGLTEKLSANRTYYVRSDGNDANTGLANTSGGALKTIAAAITAVRAINTNGKSVTIKVQDGAWTENVVVSGPMVGGGAINIVGNESTPANCTLTVASSKCFYISDHASVSIRGFKMSAPGTNGSAIYCTTGAVVTHGNNDFGACDGPHIDMGDGGKVLGLWNYTISAGAVSHWHAGVPSVIDTLNITITLTGTPNFTGYFAGCAAGYIRFINVTFSGTALGRKFYVHKNGTIDGMGAAVNALPGTLPGEWYSNGRYIGDVETIDLTLDTFDIAGGVRCRNDTAGTGPFLIVDRESASPAANDAIGAIVLGGRSSTQALVFYGMINAIIDDPTQGSAGGTMRLNTFRNGANGDRVFVRDGLYMLAAAGGDRGSGTINAVGLYDDNVAVTDLVLDFAVQGSFDVEAYKDHPIASEMEDWWLDPASYASYWKEHRRLPGMLSWDDPEEKPSTGEMITRLTAVVETQAVLLDKLHQRLEALIEAKST